MNYLLSFIIISFSILLHEAGHLISGKLARVPMSQFSIGFGPALFSRSWQGTRYKFSILPVGGYVLPQIENENDFFAIPVWRRLFFTIGGPVFNLLFAYGLFLLINIHVEKTTAIQALLLSARQMLIVISSIFTAFSQLFHNPEHLSGIVGAVSSGGQYIHGNWIHALSFAALLNINLAIFNLLPIPPLDGGKIITYLLECIDQRLVKIQIPLSIAGWAILLLLMVFATYQDIISLLGSGT